VINIAEEDPKMDPEAPERDGDMSRVPASAMGICSMECLRRKELQSRKGPSAEAFEAGFDDGYGEGYVDGYDDGQFNQLVGLIRELQTWSMAPCYLCPDSEWAEGHLCGLMDVLRCLEERLEHDGKSDDRP